MVLNLCFTHCEITSTLHNLKAKITCGPDNIKADMLKLSTPALQQALVL